MRPLDAEIFEFMTALAEQIVDLQEQVSQLTAHTSSPSLIQNQIDLGLPRIQDMRNLELTFFDNGDGRGRARYKIKAEVVTNQQTNFRGKRDHQCFAELHTPIDLRLKLNRRTISVDYRELLQDILDALDQTENVNPTLIGMFGAKGGKSGQVWYHKQMIMVTHNGEYKPQVAILQVGDECIQSSDFDQNRNPITKKPFNSEKIKGKAINVFAREEE